MDTVSWLSFFTASGLGAALGVLSLTALGACLYLRAPGQRRQPCWGRPPAPERGLWEAAGENRWSAWRERPWWSGMRICSTRWDGVM